MPVGAALAALFAVKGGGVGGAAVVAVVVVAAVVVVRHVVVVRVVAAEVRRVVVLARQLGPALGCGCLSLQVGESLETSGEARALQSPPCWGPVAVPCEC